MSRLHSIRWPVVVFGLLFTAATVFAQEQKENEYEPHVGQPGKDVVWVPTQQDLVDKMLDMAKVTPQDYVIDLGSGDGRTVITAAKRGARALGIEYNPDMVELSKRNAAQAEVSDRATFMKADLFESDFSKATVITMFLLPDINLKLRPKLLSLKPGVRVVSNSFTMEEWKADEVATIPNCTTWCTAYLWIIPAKVDGTWRLSNGELTLKQEFQKVSGTLVSGGKNSAITGTLSGDRISFFDDAGIEYSGKVEGATMSGTRKSGETWKATKE